MTPAEELPATPGLCRRRQPRFEWSAPSGGRSKYAGFRASRTGSRPMSRGDIVDDDGVMALRAIPDSLPGVAACRKAGGSREGRFAFTNAAARSPTRCAGRCNSNTPPSSASSNPRSKPVGEPRSSCDRAPRPHAARPAARHGGDRERGGRSRGITVSAFFPVSLEPPLVVVSIGNEARAPPGESPPDASGSICWPTDQAGVFRHFAKPRTLFGRAVRGRLPEGSRGRRGGGAATDSRLHRLAGVPDGVGVRRGRSLPCSLAGSSRPVWSGARPPPLLYHGPRLPAAGRRSAGIGGREK